MTYQFSLAYLTVGNLEPSAQVYVGARAGYDYVSLRPIPMGLPGEPSLDLAHDATLLADCRQALRDTGMRVWDIELARVLDDVDYVDYEPAVTVGAELGAQVLLTSVWTADHAKQVEGLGRVAELAAAHGLEVVSEFVPLSQVKTLRDMAALIREVNAPNLGMLIDAYHYDRGNTDFADFAALPRAWFPMLHVCDCPAEKPADAEALREEVRERRLYVGEGCVPIADILRHLGGDVVLSIEQPNFERVRLLGETEFAARSLEHAKRYLAAHGLA